MAALAYDFNDTASNTILTGETHNIQNLMLKVGFPQHVYGYNYIMYALELIFNEPDILHRITKELYPSIAKKYQTTPSRVERAIRHSVSIVWLHGNTDVIYKIFGHSIRPDKGVPTNSQLLAGFYYYLSQNNLRF